MSYAKEFCLLIVIVLVLCLSISETAESQSHVNKALNNATINETVIRTSTLSSNPSVGTKQNLVHNAFAKMDRGTVIRGAIVLSGITGLILMYAGIKAAVLRKKNQPKKYTLIDNLTSMEEPLFGEQNNEEDAEDDTLFTRK